MVLKVKAVSKMASRLLSKSTNSKNALVLATILAMPLWLSVIPVNEGAFAQTSSPPVTVQTDNNSVSVIVDWTPEEIQAEQDVDFSLGFQDASSGQTLSHVNYNLRIVDPSSGAVVKSVDGIHTHSGQDVQTVKFDNLGDFRLDITVIGLGINQPFDTSKSGTAQTAIVVVPEFPFALASMAVGVAIIVLLARSRHFASWKFFTG
ncbi:MAG: hypothetical protein MN733_41705, partial [Nitrososphaera sp.]|nr:hypothetical protein [Nitrososphaera sp.]